MLVGEVKNGVQRFDRDKASSDTFLLLLAVIALVIPSVLSQVGHGNRADLDVEILSLGVAGLMIIIYALGLLFGFRLDSGPLTRSQPNWSFTTRPGRSGKGYGSCSHRLPGWCGEVKFWSSTLRPQLYNIWASQNFSWALSLCPL